MERQIDTAISKKTAFLVLLLSVGFNAIGQLLFKASRLAQPDASIIQLFFQVELWVGLVLYGLSAVTWLWVLSKVPLSYAYPILALSFPIVVALSAFTFSETISLVQAGGLALIIIGVSMLART
jgi:multidrug transporter EmrE-like cation transporter